MRAAYQLDAWDVLLPVIATMCPDSLRRLAALPAVREEAVLARIVGTALAGPTWLDLLPLTMHLPGDLLPMSRGWSPRWTTRPSGDSRRGP